VDDNDIETAAEVVVKSSINKSKNKKFSLFNRSIGKLTWKEIAESKALSFEETAHRDGKYLLTAALN